MCNSQCPSAEVLRPKLNGNTIFLSIINAAELLLVLEDFIILISSEDFFLLEKEDGANS